MDLIDEPTTPHGFFAKIDEPTIPEGFVVGLDELTTPEGAFIAFQKLPSDGSSNSKRKPTQKHLTFSPSPSPPLKLAPNVKSKPKRSAEDEWFLNTLLSLTAEEFRLYYKLVSDYLEQREKESRKISVLWCR